MHKYLKCFSEKCLEFDNELKGNDAAKSEKKNHMFKYKMIALTYAIRSKDYN